MGPTRNPCFELMSCPFQSLSALGGNHRLREIVLSGCENITDLGLQKFAQQCRDIERLDISFCHVSGQFVHEHLHSIKKVQVRLVFHMFKKHQLTRQIGKNLGNFIFLFWVYFWKVQHLPVLSLGHDHLHSSKICFQQLTDGAIKNLAFCCRLLTTINLSGCRQVSR